MLSLFHQKLATLFPLSLEKLVQCLRYRSATQSTAGRTRRVAVRREHRRKRGSGCCRLIRSYLFPEEKKLYTIRSYCDSVPNYLDIKINKEDVKRIDRCKYLGVHTDCSLKWDKHIIPMVKKTQYLMFTFAKISKIMRSETLWVLYNIIRFFAVWILMV